MKTKVSFGGRDTEEFPSFWNYISDMYSFPGIVKLRFPATGKQGLLQDRENIRGYFKKSLKDLDVRREIREE